MSSHNSAHVLSSHPTTSLDTAVKFTKDSGIGAISAVVAKTLVAPIERVKLILQVCVFYLEF
jgi:hypothetical protein